ncbi:MAG: carbohydrate-binding domain-containing protein [Ruminococcaceae bacterium]|nr:carbohydrate-binding domain-containing protein [Oscillospiraceae bacterium]
MNKLKKALCLTLVFLFAFSGCERQESSYDKPKDIILADTNGMDFGFDEEDVNADVVFGENVDITFDDAPDTEDTSTGESGAFMTEQEAPETQVPETQVPETQVPETQAPETQAPETQAPETQAPETQAPETQAPETQASGTQVPETQVPETLAPETRKTEPTAVPEITEIKSGGTYTLSGTKKDTTILIDAGDSDVQLILNGVTVQNNNGPAIYIRSADKVIITLADGTVNTISDGSNYSVTDSDSTLDAAIFSKADLTVNGSGTLVLNGNYKHGIVSKDDLIISSGTLNVTAKNVGLSGKDCVKINSGNITINAGSDGVRSDNDEDTSKGYVYLYGGTVSITAGNDGIQAETVINIEDVNLTVTAGGGSSGYLTSSEESYKGLKAVSDIYITGGTFDLNAKDDCIHSNGTITISGGKYTLSSSDDGIHADTDLAISGSATELTVNKSYEGIEATNIVITDGRISIVASDDGINAAGGNNSTMGTGGRPGKGSFSFGNGSIQISGGDIYINMSGDGLDANGTLAITGGSIVVSGPNRGDTAILDFDTTGNITGGIFVGTGASSMSQNFSSSSTQGAMMIATGSQASGTVVTLTDSGGNTLISRETESEYSCVILSHPEIKAGETYTLTAGTYTATITMDATVYSSGRTGMPGNQGFPGNNRVPGDRGARKQEYQENFN